MEEKDFLDSLSKEIEKEINNLILSDDFFTFRRFVDKKVLKNEKEIEKVLDFGCFNYGGFCIAVNKRYIRISLGKIGDYLEKNGSLSLLSLKECAKKEALKTVITSIERDLLMNAFIYLDILGVCDVNDSQNVNYIKGKSLGPNKKFNKGKINIEQVNYDVDVGTIEGYAIGKLTMESVLKFASILSDDKAQSFDKFDCGSYVIILNDKAYNNLLEDSNFSSVASKQDASRGYIGTCYGLEFWRDHSKMIDRFVTSLNPVLKDKAICIFALRNSVIEVMVSPIKVKLYTPDRCLYKLKIETIGKGESPIWFASTCGIVSGGVLVGV
jgi:hypothetical protein